MDFEREKKNLEKRLAAAQAKLEAATQRRAAAKQRLKSQKIEAREKAEKWHRFSLAHHLREAGYTGHHAIALMTLRSLPFERYVEFLRSAQTLPEDSLITVERRFVEAKLAELVAAGKKALLKRDQERYDQEQQKWADWQRANPEIRSWRGLKPTKQQTELVMRIMDAKELPMPALLTRGEAHDWISAQGGNPRLGH